MIRKGYYYPMHMDNPSAPKPVIETAARSVLSGRDAVNIAT